jgi:hypothetical protein
MQLEMNNLKIFITSLLDTDTAHDTDTARDTDTVTHDTNCNLRNGCDQIQLYVSVSNTEHTKELSISVIRFITC